MRVRLKHERLAKEIAASRLTQNRWAQKMGISRGHLSNLVNGRFLYPSPRTRSRLMKSLGLDFDDLFEIEIPKRHPSRSPRPWTLDLGPSTSSQKGSTMWIATLRYDLKHALRRFLRQPASSAAAALTLALGIAANLSIFSLVNAALFRPLPVKDVSGLVNIYTSRSDGSSFSANSWADFQDFPRDPEIFAGYLGYGAFMATVTEAGSAEAVFGEMATFNYFDLLGIQPILGRGFREADDVEGAAPVAVISHSMWQRRFGASDDVLGRILPLNARPFRIVGVAPPSFHGMLARGINLDVWVPLVWAKAFRSAAGENAALQSRSNRWLHVKARLAQGSSLESARQSLEQTATELERIYPQSNQGRRLRVLATSSVLFHPDGDGGITILAALLMAAVCLVLLVACANIANLLLAQAARRQRELGVRRALGAGRVRLALQLISESMLLALAGGLAGSLLSLWLSRLLVRFNPPLPVPLHLDLQADWRVALYGGAVTLAAGFLVGLIPAFSFSRRDLSEALKRSLDHGGRSRLLGLRNLFLLPQVALSLCLLMMAGLLLHSLLQAGWTEFGFDSRRTALTGLQLSQSGYDEQSARRFLEQLREEVEALPEVASSSLTSWVPLGAIYGSSSTVLQVGDASFPSQAGRVGDRFFATLDIPVLQGRPFSRFDLDGQSEAAVVSAALARKLWPDENPMGQRFRQGGPDGPWFEVVGVVADVKVQTLGEADSAMLYRPLDSGHSGLIRLLVRTRGEPAGLLPQIRRLILSKDDQVAIFDAKTMGEHIDVNLYPFRLAAAIGGCLAAVALLLAALGLSAVASLAVARRYREMGIRIALGAQRKQAVQLVVRQGMKVVLLGWAAGLLLAWGASQLLSSWLFGIQPIDPLTFVAAPGALLLLAWAAIYLPARRLHRIEPSALLRVQ